MYVHDQQLPSMGHKLFFNVLWDTNIDAMGLTYIVTTRLNWPAGN